jgi:hypothetical protein
MYCFKLEGLTYSKKSCEISLQQDARPLPIKGMTRLLPSVAFRKYFSTI